MSFFKRIYIDEGLDANVSNRLRIRYIVGLGAIAISIILSNHFARNFLEKQVYDSRVINVAGRQRMLSQKITKEALLIRDCPLNKDKQKYANMLKQTLDLWVKSHKGLQFGDDKLGLPGTNSAIVDSMFAQINAHHDSIAKAANNIIFVTLSTSKGTEIGQDIKTILKYEAGFLDGMNRIVFQYDSEANKKVLYLIRTENLLLALALSFLFLEFLFIFAPAARYVQRIIAELMDAEAKERRLNKQLTSCIKKLNSRRASLTTCTMR
ncbi:MAG: hypothetical protein HC896_15085 [Bacteroidales bacterium]|nr:hypothetical protein [Bacteroidales bacterium]